MNNQNEVIILRSSDYKDNDAILNVLSEKYGKLSFVARGVRKIKSKNANNCNVYNLSNFHFDYKEQASMQSLKTAENVNNFRKIREDLVKQSLASVMVEIMDKASVDDTFVSFHLLKKSLEYLNVTKNPLALFALYLAKCCELNGISPFVDGCVLCSNQKDLIAISHYDGGFICKNCFDTSRHQKRDVSMLKFFRLINKADIEQFSYVEEINPCSFKDVEDILNIFMEYSGTNLKSLTFLRHILDVSE